MKDKELREIVYELVQLLDDNKVLYGDKLPPTNSNCLMAKVDRLKQCRCNF